MTKNNGNGSKTASAANDNLSLFYELLKAESEEQVTTILTERGMLDEGDWQPLGETENNWSSAGNQQSAASGALVEKLINGIDAVLLYECQKRGITPASPAAPESMTEAVRLFFNIPNGRLESIEPRQRTALAENVHLVAVGSKQEPNYLIVDKGEGQSPGDFPETFLSLAKSNKLHIHFVQGKYNAGGTGALRFCGTQNYQLIVSKRAPGLECRSSDPRQDEWGFTLIRRLRPTEGGRRSSMYVYYAPGKDVPSFSATTIDVLPNGGGSSNKPPQPYAIGLEFGSCVKLYNFRWRAAGTATLDARYELDKYLYNVSVPIRVTETRAYRANSYSTTVSGGSIDSNAELDLGPASGSIALPHNLGKVPVELKVFKNKKADKTPVETRHLPKGVIFTVNGQVHGSLKSNFIARKLNYEFLEDHLLVVLDATNMPIAFREDFFMTSRDRLTESEDRDFIEAEIRDFLKRHEGLRELNSKRKEEAISKSVEESQPLDLLQELLRDDPSLADLFGPGTKLKILRKRKIITDDVVPEFHGKPFPTYFRLKKSPLIKDCPVNARCRIDFETDAMDNYFSRGNEPGTFSASPAAFASHGLILFHGKCVATFSAPLNAEVGDIVDVKVVVSDPSREVNPFEIDFKIRFTQKVEPQKAETRPKFELDEVKTIAFPKIHDAQQDKWVDHKFDEYSGLRFTGGHDEEPLEAYVNVDNVFFVNELVGAKDDAERVLLRYYYKFGMVLVALGMLQEAKRRRPEEPESANLSADDLLSQDLQAVARFSGGVAAVIIPVVRNLAAAAARIGK